MQHTIIELEGLRLLAALKHLMAAWILPDLNSTDPNPYLIRELRSSHWFYQA
jgi:hypothetical protein